MSRRSVLSGIVLSGVLIAGTVPIASARVRPATVGVPIPQQAYLKPSNAGAGDSFGNAIAISGDTIVVGAYTEKSNGSGPTDDSASNAGAAYVFV